MERKYQLIVFVFSLFLVTSPIMASAQIMSSIIVTTDRTVYSDGDRILITGEVSDLSLGVPILLRVISPNGNLVSIAQIDIYSDGRFSTELIAGGLISSEGTYTIDVSYGSQSHATTTFTFSGSTGAGYASGQMIADAGVDQIVNENVKISLDGSKSNDPEGQKLSYMWSQVSGETVKLSSTSSVNPSFTSPIVANNEIKVLVFELKVFDNNGRAAVDTVTITVDPVNTPTPTPTNQDSTIFIIIGVIAAIGFGVTVALMKRKKSPMIQTKTDDTQVWK